MEQNKYVILFFTQYGAIHYAKLLKKEGIESVTKPVPRVLSSSCGICVETTTCANLLDFITEDVEFIYRMTPQEQFEKLYESVE